MIKKDKGFFKRLRAKLNPGDSWLTADIGDLLKKSDIDESVVEDIEERLLLADVGIETTELITAPLLGAIKRKEIRDADTFFDVLSKTLIEILEPRESPLTMQPEANPFVVLVVGVNGVGKTTTIGKLAKKFQASGNRVMLAAGDTFRAAAVEQLTIWGERNDVPVIAQCLGADPAAVIFDAMQAAKARNYDVLIADTAGRLHTQKNLMEELMKINRVIKKIDPDAPHETMLVVDGSSGQNALAQARAFHEALTLTSLTITKLDGSAKGGVIFPLAQTFDLPFRFVGVGESVDDLGVFNAKQYVDALLGRA